MDISSWELFSSRTSRQENISEPWSFWHRDVTALGHFSTRIFWHVDVSGHVHFSTEQSNIKHFGTDILAWVPLRQNVHIPKHPCDEMCQCHNVPVLKCPWYRKIPMLKCSHAEMSSCRKVPVMKCSCRNVSCRNVRCQNKPKPEIQVGHLNYSTILTTD